MSPEVVFLTSSSLLVLMKIVCFILGYLIIRLGYKLIILGVKGEFKFSMNLKGLKANLVSISPGLLFVLLGVLLIGYAIYVEKVAKLEIKGGIENVRPQPPVPKESEVPFDSIPKNEQIDEK